MRNGERAYRAYHTALTAGGFICTGWPEYSQLSVLQQSAYAAVVAAVQAVAWWPVGQVPTVPGHYWWRIPGETAHGTLCVDAEDCARGIRTPPQLCGDFLNQLVPLASV